MVLSKYDPKVHVGLCLSQKPDFKKKVHYGKTQGKSINRLDSFNREVAECQCDFKYNRSEDSVSVTYRKEFLEDKFVFGRIFDADTNDEIISEEMFDAKALFNSQKDKWPEFDETEKIFRERLIQKQQEIRVDDISVEYNDCKFRFKRCFKTSLDHLPMHGLDYIVEITPPKQSEFWSTISRRTTVGYDDDKEERIFSHCFYFSLATELVHKK